MPEITIRVLRTTLIYGIYSQHNLVTLFPERLMLSDICFSAVYFPFMKLVMSINLMCYNFNELGLFLKHYETICV